MSEPADGSGRLAGLDRLTAGGEHWFLIASAVVNAGNFLFFGIIGHFLEPSQYGAAASLLNVVSLSNIPLNALQVAVVQQMLVRRSDSTDPGLPHLAWPLLGVALAPAIVTAGLSVSFAHFLGLGNVLPVLLLAAWFVPSIVGAFFTGALMAAARWRDAAIPLIGGAVVRVIAAVAFGIISPSVAGPILATLLNAVLTLYLLWRLRGSAMERASRPTLGLPLRTLLPTLGSLGAYAVLLAVDTLLARHSLGHAASGGYAAAATLAKIALIVPTTVALVVFPRFVKTHALGEDGRRQLLGALGAGLGVGLLGAAVMALVPHLLVSIVFGHKYASAAGILPILGVEAALLGGLGIMTYFHVAERRWAAVLPLGCVIEVVILALAFHHDAHSLALLMAVSVGVCLLVSVAAALPPRPRSAHGGLTAAPDEPGR